MFGRHYESNRERHCSAGNWTRHGNHCLLCSGYMCRTGNRCIYTFKGSEQSEREEKEEDSGEENDTCINVCSD